MANRSIQPSSTSCWRRSGRWRQVSASTPLLSLEFFFDLFDGDADDARSHHAERACGTDGNINDPAVYEWATIVDAAADRTTPIGNGAHAAKGAGAVRTLHVAAVTSSAV